MIRDKYQSWLEKSEKGELENWKEDHFGRLALLIINDNLTRNMFRGQARAFAYDHVGYSIAKRIVEDKDVYHSYKYCERHFITLPFMHSENVDDLQKCVDL